MPWFLFLLAGVGVLAVTWRTRRRTGLAVAAVLCGLATLFWPGRFYAEKMLTDLAMPLSLLWLAILAAAVAALARNRRREAGGLLLVAGVLSTAGHGDVADALVRSLENRYREVDPFAAGSFDAICVLGGGLSNGPGRRIMANDAGDRVVLGARLYHAGVAPELVCTGRTPPLDPILPSAAEITAAAWEQLGVPPEKITKVAGANTRAEIGELKRLATERGWTKLGLVTSAWHLGRASRLADAAGLAITPLPADFRSSIDRAVDPWLRVRTFSLIPSPGALGLTHLAIKEYLAGIVGR